MRSRRGSRRGFQFQRLRRPLRRGCASCQRRKGYAVSGRGAICHDVPRLDSTDARGGHAHRVGHLARSHPGRYAKELQFQSGGHVPMVPTLVSAVNPYIQAIVKVPTFGASFWEWRSLTTHVGGMALGSGTTGNGSWATTSQR